MNPAAMEQIAKGWGMRTAAAAAPYSSGSEPSWEEQAFARDAAACSLVWPPRSYSCTFCHREFRSAQALGGHMNVHRRDRARLRHGDSPSPDHDAPPHDQDQDSLMYRAISNLSAATIIKESNNKVLMSLAAVRDQQAIDHDHDDGEDESGRTTKRRRVDHQPAVAALPTIFALVVAPQGGFDHDTDAIKVPKTTASPSSSSLLVDHQQEVDLELRLGTTPKVSSQVFSMPKKKDE